MIPPSQEEDYERGIIKDVNGKPFDSQSIVERLQEYHGSDSSSDSDVDLNKKPKSKKIRRCARCRNNGNLWHLS
jgi:hypothetical protein